MCLVKIWVNKTGFQWSTCTKTRHWVIMYLCTRAVDFASLNFWFWNCSDSVVCFVSRFIIYIILLCLVFIMVGNGVALWVESINKFPIGKYFFSGSVAHFKELHGYVQCKDHLDFHCYNMTRGEYTIAISIYSPKRLNH
jgi:hypothetical protein